MGQQTFIPALLSVTGPCLKGLTSPICSFPSVSLPHHRDIVRNCAISVDQIQDLHSPMSPISENPPSPAYSTGRHHASITWDSGDVDEAELCTGVMQGPGEGDEAVCKVSVSLGNPIWLLGCSTVGSSLCACLHVLITRSLLSTVTRLKPHACQVAGVAPASPVIRRSSEPQLCPGNNSKILPDPAYSTHSTPCHGYAHASPSPSMNSYSDPDTGHYCQLHPTSPTSRERPPHDTKQLPTKSYVERLKVEKGQRGTVENSSGEAEAGKRLKGELDFMGFVPPVVETTSSFNPIAFQSMLIPLENKPLEMAVLKKVKELLAEVDVKTLAKHITKVDCLVWAGIGIGTAALITLGSQGSSLWGSAILYQPGQAEAGLRQEVAQG